MTLPQEGNINIYNKKILTKNITISADNLNSNIDELIHKTLNDELNGICINEGYVKPDSSKILMRSEGNLRINNFKSVVYYTIKYEVLICNPVENQILTCNVSDVSKSHITCYIETEDTSPLNVFLSKQHHLGDSEYTKIKIDDVIEVKVLAKKFEYLDKQILVIGNFLKII
jgi:DNA-directed RNA polymerase subunit E'/Rpb7